MKQLMRTVDCVKRFLHGEPTSGELISIETSVKPNWLLKGMICFLIDISGGSAWRIDFQSLQPIPLIYLETSIDILKKNQLVGAIFQQFLPLATITNFLTSNLLVMVTRGWKIWYIGLPSWSFFLNINRIFLLDQWNRLKACIINSSGTSAPSTC